jgi:hypothetical protein
MSLGLAYAQAWLTADMAYSKRKAEEEFQQLKNEFNELVEDYSDSQESDSLVRGIVSLVGAGVGFATGGVSGAFKGYQAGETIYGAVDPYQKTLGKKQDAIEDFEWKLTNDDSIKYSKILERMDPKISAGERLQDSYESAIDSYMEGTFNPWYEDIAAGALDVANISINPAYDAMDSEWQNFQTWFKEN